MKENNPNKIPKTTVEEYGNIFNIWYHIVPWKHKNSYSALISSSPSLILCFRQLQALDVPKKVQNTAE